jgi:hypothetical protein
MIGPSDDVFDTAQGLQIGPDIFRDAGRNFDYTPCWVTMLARFLRDGRDPFAVAAKSKSLALRAMTTLQSGTTNLMSGTPDLFLAPTR